MNLVWPRLRHHLAGGLRAEGGGQASALTPRASFVDQALLWPLAVTGIVKVAPWQPVSELLSIDTAPASGPV